MVENNYYKQIINAFINQNAHDGISYCFSDDESTIAFLVKSGTEEDFRRLECCAMSVDKL